MFKKDFHCNWTSFINASNSSEGMLNKHCYKRIIRSILCPPTYTVVARDLIFRRNVHQLRDPPNLEQLFKFCDLFKCSGDVKGWISNGWILNSGGVPSPRGGSATNGATQSSFHPHSGCVRWASVSLRPCTASTSSSCWRPSWRAWPTWSPARGTDHRHSWPPAPPPPGCPASVPP